MNETQVKMMEAYGVMVLPEDIDHDAYMLVVEGLHYARHCGHEQVIMYCAGLGGDLPAALAIADLIRQHGNVVGLLPGQADSCHAMVWLACAERYVYPLGCMGIHETKYVMADNTKIDARHAKNFVREVESYNHRLCLLLEEACSKYPHHVCYWEDQLSDIGASGFRHYDEVALANFYGIAKPIAEFVEVSPADERIEIELQNDDDADRASPVPTKDGQSAFLFNIPPDVDAETFRESLNRLLVDAGVNSTDARKRVPTGNSPEVMQSILTGEQHPVGGLVDDVGSRVLRMSSGDFEFMAQGGRLVVERIEDGIGYLRRDYLNDAAPSVPPASHGEDEN